MERASKRREYHHGNLRSAVLKAAFALVKKQGLKELTLREVARKIGVTHAAPYHHFKSRDALLDAMADQAFQELDAALAQAQPVGCNATERLFALGRAYIDFARSRPERIELMFRRKEDKKVEPLALESGQRAFQHLVDALTALQEEGLAPAGDPLSLTLSAWSMVHGFALLWVEGPLDAMPPYEGKFEALRDEMLRNFGQWLRAAAGAESLSA